MDGPQHMLLAAYSESDRRGSSGSLVVVVTVVVTFFHDDVSQRSFYWAGFIFPGLKSLGGWASACAVGGVFRVGLEGFEWFFGGGGGGDGGGDGGDGGGDGGGGDFFPRDFWIFQSSWGEE